MKTPRNYYGFEHNWGSTTCVQGAPHGDGGTIYVFSSKKECEAWVDNGSDYVTERGARTTYPAKKVRKHVITGEWGEVEITTRELVEKAIREGSVEDCR